MEAVKEHELYRLARERSIFDQKKAAAMANVTPSTQCKYEKGSLEIPVEVLTRLHDTPMGRTSQFTRLLQLRCSRCPIGQMLDRRAYKKAS
ncbi:hypothetical protein [Phosphitispora fastidiosa]|uniref:hypothetical protein n=1 Tax=Phosphitispora fastidiosa TaxID=2837202 RepID=UPI001E5CF0BA|nr:hypothetical protein [Phosphitispora fastidiosa]MBU7006351.1 transcriptional regulator with XRE-family HTH domain [Phosphitispora fastidiosa]